MFLLGSLDPLGSAALCLAAVAGWLLGCGATIMLLERRWRRDRPASREIDRNSAAEVAPEVAPGSDLVKLLAKMREHRERGDFSQRVEIDLHSDVCQLAAEYNRVLDRAKAEIASREEAEQQFRGIFDNAIEGIFQTTPAGKYIRANAALARIYGFPTAEQLIAGLPDIAAQLYVDPSRRNEFIRLLETHDVITAFESQVYRADGSVIWISENARAHRNANGELLYYEGSVEDVTERRDSERLLRDKCAAETANRAKSEFLASMSHEIRTPLNGVVGMLDLLGSTPLTAQQTRYAEIAKSSAAVLLNLINDILDFSKVEAGKLEIEHVPFDLRQVVEDVPEMFLYAASQKKVELSCHIASSVPRTVRGDSERVRQILVNLVGNAIKFTPRGSVTCGHSVHPWRRRIRLSPATISKHRPHLAPPGGAGVEIWERPGRPISG